MRHILHTALAVSFCALAVSADAQTARAPGGLQILPTRVVFDDRTRASALTLINSGDKPTTYRLEFVEMKMNADGALVEVPASENPMRAEPLIRFSPRQVTLEPGVAQTVRLQVRKPAELAQGEYRSHLVFRAVPDLTAAPALTASNGKGLSVNLIAIYGISIPIIVRHGETNVQLSLSDVALEESKQGKPPSLAMKLHRTGTRSGYGDLVASYVTPDGKEQPLAIQKGIGVYVPNDHRAIRVPLSAVPAARNGKVRVKFTDPEGGATLASAEVALR